MKSNFQLGNFPGDQRTKPFGETLMREALVRWKYQRFVKNYLRCLRGIDENVGRIVSGINEILGKKLHSFLHGKQGEVFRSKWLVWGFLGIRSFLAHSNAFT